MLSKDELLRRTNNGLDIFRHYIPGQWRIGRNFLNPLYEDRKASCNIWFDRRGGCYRLKDFGNDDFSGDCFFYAGKLKGLDCNNSKDFVEILQIINRDMNLGLSDNGDTSFIVSVTSAPPKSATMEETPPRQPDTPKKAKPYSVIPQSFSTLEKRFWEQYGITSDVLKIYKVVSLKEFRSENREGRPFTMFATDDEPLFGYQGKHTRRSCGDVSDSRRTARHSGYFRGILLRSCQ